MMAWALFCHDFDLSKGINILSEKCPVVLDHYSLYQEQRSEYPTQWAATVSIASKFGCTPETLRTWIKKFEADLADNGAAADQAQRIKQLERDNKELQRANEILRKAAAFFAQAELDRK